MTSVVVGVFLILHGLVHLLYFGQSQKMFELQPGMTWPDGAWAFSKLLGDGATRTLAGVLLIVAAAAFAAGGLGVFIKQAWWRPVVVGAAVFSTVLYLLFWNGKMQGMDNQGGVAILINLAILVAVLILHWPVFNF